MTIRGIAIRTKDVDTKELPIDIAYIDANPWIPLRESSKGNVERVNNEKYF